MGTRNRRQTPMVRSPAVAERLTLRKRHRRMAMLHAYLQFHARKFSKEDRERSCWLLLLIWARLGGTPDEVKGLTCLTQNAAALQPSNGSIGPLERKPESGLPALVRVRQRIGRR
jgi:hypothetical protein